jgi:hypothetical protein
VGRRRDGWIAHLQRRRDETAGVRLKRTLSDAEWAAALQSQVGEEATEALEYLSAPTGRRRPWRVPIARMSADTDAHRALGVCGAGPAGHRRGLPVVGELRLGPPASRARWDEAVEQLADEAGALLPR